MNQGTMIPAKYGLRIGALLMCLNVVLHLQAQNVTNVRFDMTRNKVVIQYDLDSEDDSARYCISVYPSVNGGKTFGPKLKEISGDLNKVPEGKDKTIFWNFRKEYLKGDGDVILELRASKILEIDYGGEELEITEVKASATGYPISNIRYSEHNGQVVFLYDIDCVNDSSEFFVSVNPSFNGGRSFGSRLLAIEGDYSSVGCGKDRTIMWNIHDEKDFLSQAGQYSHLDSSASGFPGSLGAAVSMIEPGNETKAKSGRKEILFEIRAIGSAGIISGEDTLVVVEVMPWFPGGEQEMFRYIFENLNYPPEARDQGIQGMVLVRFVVTTEGKIDKVSVARSVHPLLDAEAVRVVSMMPDWSPGLKGGTPVNVWFFMPVTFRIR
ncbi:MAG: energy transducer TonB [Bacteroidales bacterium]|jgi:protein TonB|nr:energy transducer TonB [Bacteroidales bacterium]